MQLSRKINQVPKNVLLHLGPNFCMHNFYITFMACCICWGHSVYIKSHIRPSFWALIQILISWDICVYPLPLWALNEANNEMKLNGVWQSWISGDRWGGADGIAGSCCVKHIEKDLLYAAISQHSQVCWLNYN